MNYELNVLVNGRKVDVYKDPREFDNYIEGRDKSEYQLELVNNTWTDAEFVVSVDGLSIIDGKPAGKESNGWLVRAKSSTKVDGWLVDPETVAKFVFGSKSNSYSAVSGNGEDNTGVIGLRVYTKKQYFPPAKVFRGATDYNDIMKPFHEFRDYTVSYSTSDLIGSNASNVSFGAATSAASNNTGPSLESFTYPDEVCSLGTEFGPAASQKTTKVEFTRSSETPTYKYTLHYATAKELNKLGITLKWQVVSKQKPNAFPADFCAPPAGWSKE